MNVLFIILFIIFSIIHLIYSWKEDGSGRAKTKPFLIFFLMLFYIFSASSIKPLIVLALFTSWLGDVLLIPKGNKWFISGGVSFLLSHLLFIAVYIALMSSYDVNWGHISLITVVYLIITILIMRKVYPFVSRTMGILLTLYLMINGAMNVFALERFIICRGLPPLIPYVGAILFYASDSILFWVKYDPSKKHMRGRSFWIMLTYLLGELLITIGLLNS